MKVILTADLHIQDGIYVNICLDYIDYLSTYAQNNNINTIMFLGDILHKANKMKYDTFVPLFKKLEELKQNGFRLYFILGNHDIYTMERDSLIETFSPFGIVIKDKEIITIDGVDICLCSYTSDQTLVPTVGADYLFTHLSIADFSFDNDMEVKDKSSFKPELFDNYKKVFTGHFHKRQEKHNIEYVGSPYQLSYGEAGDTNKGFVVFEPSTGNEEFVKYENAPKYAVLSYEDIAENGVDKEDIKNSFVKILVSKKIENFSKLRTVLYKVGAIDVRPEFPKKVQDEEGERIKIDINKNLSDMMIDFISSKKFTSGSSELDSNELIKKIKEIQSEL